MQAQRETKVNTTDSRTMQRRAELGGLLAGLTGGLAATALLTGGVLTGGMPVVALALWERALRVMPMEVFGFLIVRLKFLAKPLAFWGMLGSVVIALGVVGYVLARWRALRSRPVAGGAAAWVLAFVPLTALTVGPASEFLQARPSNRVRGELRTQSVDRRLWKILIDTINAELGRPSST